MCYVGVHLLFVTGGVLGTLVSHTLVVISSSKAASGTNHCVDDVFLLPFLYALLFSEIMSSEDWLMITPSCL